MTLRKISGNNIERNINYKLRQLDPLPKEAHTYFVSQTPIRTGNAQRSTGFIKQNTIDANYAYANRLNEGYSRQSPEGMTNPTISYLRRRIRKILG